MSEKAKCQCGEVATSLVGSPTDPVSRCNRCVLNAVGLINSQAHYLNERYWHMIETHTLFKGKWIPRR